MVQAAEVLAAAAVIIIINAQRPHYPTSASCHKTSTSNDSVVQYLDLVVAVSTVTILFHRNTSIRAVDRKEVNGSTYQYQKWTPVSKED